MRTLRHVVNRIYELRYKFGLLIVKDDYELYFELIDVVIKITYA